MIVDNNGKQLGESRFFTRDSLFTLYNSHLLPLFFSPSIHHRLSYPVAVHGSPLGSIQKRNGNSRVDTSARVRLPSAVVPAQRKADYTMVVRPFRECVLDVGKSGMFKQGEGPPFFFPVSHHYYSTPG